MADFHFLRPWWLLALLPLAAFYWRLLVIQKTQSGWHQWLPNHLAQVLVASGGKQTPWSAHRLGLFWLISSVALAGPTWERLPQPVYQLETGQVVIMDMSPSVLATDIQPSRLTQLRFKAMDLVKSGLDGDTGLIAYADDAFIISPLTADNNNLLNLIPSLSPEIMPRSGSEPLRALKLADELLRNAGYAEGDIYWLTDGIATSELNALTQYLRQQSHRVSILGVGTEQGAPIRDSDGNLLKDRFGQTVIAKLVPSRLSDLARLTGGIYETVRADNSDIAQFVQQPPLTREGKDGDQQQQGDQWRDNGPFLALLLIPIMLFSWRRGGSLGTWLALALLPLLSMTSTQVIAQEQKSAPSWWLNQSQQAQQLLMQEDYQAAAELSRDPLRRGVAQYRAGDYNAAADSFAQLDSAEGWYNRGNALAQQQQFEAAKEAYQTALDKKPNWTEAEQNSALMDELLQEQQQQQQGENDQQDGEQEQDDSRQQQGQNQDNQNQNNDAGNNQGQQGESQQSQQQDQSDDGKQEGEAEQKPQQQQPQNREQQAQQDGQQDANPQQQQRNSQTQFADDIDPERAQQLEQWMNRIPDDPSILLRNKMLLESQRRNQRRASQPEGVKQKW